jgi:type I restriction enzyme, S subunit
MIVYEIRPTDLLITMMGTTGNCQIVPRNILRGIMDSHLIRIRFNEKKMLSFFAQILVSQANYVKEQIDSIGQGSIMSGLNSSIIKSLVFVVPPINDQRILIDYIELQNRRIDEMMKKIEAQIEKLQEYRQALITSAVTGKIMVI